MHGIWSSQNLAWHYKDSPRGMPVFLEKNSVYNLVRKTTEGTCAFTNTRTQFLVVVVVYRHIIVYFLPCLEGIFKRKMGRFLA